MPESAEKEKALVYINKCGHNSVEFIRSLDEKLSEEITQEELSEVTKQFYRSYDLRMAISGDRQAELEDQ